VRSSVDSEKVFYLIFIAASSEFLRSPSKHSTESSFSVERGRRTMGIIPGHWHLFGMHVDPVSLEFDVLMRRVGRTLISSNLFVKKFLVARLPHMNIYDYLHMLLIPHKSMCDDETTIDVLCVCWLLIFFIHFFVHLIKSICLLRACILCLHLLAACWASKGKMEMRRETKRM
jgi:hypothetical protein